MTEQDDDAFVRSALAQVKWPAAPLHMKGDILRAIDLPHEIGVPPYMVSGRNLPRLGSWLAALMMVIFACGLLAGMGTAETETTDPLYKDSGTVMMAQLLE